MMGSKPKMLFVDDSSKRIHSALRKYGEEYELTISPNVPETLRLLSKQEWDVVSLDFDLDGNDFGDPDSKTCAMEIVRYLGRTGWPITKPIPAFWVHSSNEFGSTLLIHSLCRMFPNANHRIRKEVFVYDECAT